MQLFIGQTQERSGRSKNRMEAWTRPAPHFAITELQSPISAMLASSNMNQLPEGMCTKAW